jgi:hypothetical protein
MPQQMYLCRGKREVVPPAAPACLLSCSLVRPAAPAVLGSLPPAGAVHPRLLPALKTEFCVLTARACLPPAPCRLLLLFSCRESRITSGGLLLKLNDVLSLSSCPRTTGCTFRASRNSPFSPAHAPTGGTCQRGENFSPRSCPRACCLHIQNLDSQTAPSQNRLQRACNRLPIHSPIPSPPAVPCALS